MRFLRSCAMAVSLLSSVSAQTSTSDAILALATGDHATAQRILKTQVEQAQSDPLALFFQAALVHSGFGEPYNPIRACGLYLKSAVPTNPLAPQAMVLARSIHHDKAVFVDLCSAALVGEWREPTPSSFTLGPRHSIRIDGSGIVVADNGAEKRHMTLFGGFGHEWLPLRYTFLDVDRPASQRRHFVECFWWSRPMNVETIWELHWSVIEVSGTDLSYPVRAILASTPDGRPATSPDLRSLARLFVNADGDVEWYAGDDRRGIIPQREPR